jgi:uncharacterized protein YllA (UPF0747 family)
MTAPIRPPSARQPRWSCGRSSRPPSSIGDLDRHAESLGEAARHSGVTLGDGAALVMLEAGQGRDRLVAADGGFVTRRGRERFDLATLRRIAGSEPERLSPNVLLRPVVESAVLPTVAYLAGRASCGTCCTPRGIRSPRVERQLPMPRWSGVMVEPKVDRALEKFGVTLDELLGPPGVPEARWSDRSCRRR